MPDPSAPLILTLLLDPATQARFEGERRRHFPPERNHIPAHVSLFHHLPGDELPAIRLRLAMLAGRAPVPVRVAGLRSLGRGVSYGLDSPALGALRAELARDWASWLTPQDRQGFRPHVTVQNKVSPADAAALLESLRAGFMPIEAHGVGVALWRYLGGPWALVEEVSFSGDVLEEGQGSPSVALSNDPGGSSEPWGRSAPDPPEPEVPDLRPPGS